MARPKKAPIKTGMDPELLALLHKQSKVMGKKFDTAPVTLGKGGYVKGALSFGSLGIDLITGGGLPPGRMSTISGPSMSGKSTLLYQASALATAQGIPVLYLDHEASADGNYLTALGMDLEQASGEGLFLYSVPVTGENTYRYIHQMLDVFPDKNTSEFAPPQMLVCIDSFAAMIPEAQDEDPEKNMQMAAVAKIHAQYLPLVKGKMYKKNVAFVGTNQLRKKPGIVYGNPEYEPGGEALTFYADLKIQVRGKGKPEQERERHLRQSNVTVSKNKQFPPWMKIEDEHKLKIAFGYGFDRFYDALTYLKLTEQIEHIKGKNGGWQIKGFDHYKPIANALMQTDDLIIEVFKNSFRSACVDQMRSGVAFDRLFDHLDYGEMYKFDPENSGVGAGKNTSAEEDDEGAEIAARMIPTAVSPSDLAAALEG